MGLDQREIVPLASPYLQPGAWTLGDQLTQELQIQALAGIQRHQHDNDLAALLHRGGQVAHADRHLKALLRGLLSEAAAAGDIRKDVPPDELAIYCLHALTGAGRLPSTGSVQRLVKVTLAGLRPSR